MEKYKSLKILKRLFSKKYTNTLFTNKNITQFIKLRMEILNLKLNSSQVIKFNNKGMHGKNLIKTDKYLINLFFKKKLNVIDKKNLLKLYNKFSVHLRLLKIYDLKMKPKSNLETHYLSYILLGYLAYKLNEINKIQKLNFLLKINDKIILNKKKIKGDFSLKVLKMNIKKEISFIKYYTT